MMQIKLAKLPYRPRTCTFDRNLIMIITTLLETISPLADHDENNNNYRIRSIQRTVHLVLFKIALKMLGKIASQLAHSENESCIPRTDVLAVFTF